MTNKFIFTIFICLLALSKVWAQSPNMINYQGVALNSGGTAIANQNISIRTTVHNLTPTGTILYSEERNLTTETGGLFNFQIGGPGANATVGTWSGINWGTSAKHLQIEMDATGGTNFVDMGTQQLVSVPYAQYSNLSGGLIPTASINPNQINAGGATTNQVLKYDGSNWVPGADVSAFALPYIGTDGSMQSFKITNTNATGAAVQGECLGNSGIAIKGLSNGTSTQAIGIYGEATAGVGVSGYSINVGSIATNGYSIGGTGINGYSYAGTGVKASSNLGTALDVSGYTHLNGYLQINGGNTNPSAGAILTSDASGNATWKNNKVAFSARNVINTAIPWITPTKLEYTTEDFDLQNNFVDYNGAATSTSSKFTAPISGIYDISASVILGYSSAVNNITSANLILSKNGNTYAISSATPKNSLAYSMVSLSIDRKIHLNANDVIWIEVSQFNDGNDPVTTDNPNLSSHFDGVLLIAD